MTWKQLDEADGYCIYKEDKQGKKKLVKKINENKDKVNEEVELDIVTINA